MPSSLRTLLGENSASRKVLYVGLMLDRESQDRVVQWVKAHQGLLFPKIIAHHATIKFKPSAEDMADLPLGQEATVKVVGYASDHKAQAVVVDGLPVKTSGIPHVTVAVAQGVPPVYSNELLAQGYAVVRGPTLTGTIEAEYAK